MEIFKLIGSIMKKQLFLIILSVLLGVFTILASVGLISTSSVLISRAALHPDVLDLMVLIVGVRFFGISRGVFRYLERLISHNTTFKMLSLLRKIVYRDFHDNYFENNIKFRTGDIYTKIVNEVDVIKDFYLRGFFPGAIAVITGSLTFIFLSFFSLKIALTYIIFYVICGFLLPIIFFRINKKISIEENKLKAKANSVLLDIFQGIAEIEIYGLKEEGEKSIKAINTHLLRLQKKRNLISSIKDNVVVLLLSILVIITLIFGYDAIKSVGGIYYAMLPLAIMSSFEALNPMSQAVQKFYDAYISCKSILTITKSDNEEAKEIKERRIENLNLNINKISIKAGDKYLLKDFSLKVPYGKKVAIVGPSGSGKSTLLRTLLGFMRCDEGSLQIGNATYNSIPIEEIRELFTFVDQNPHFFNTTIAENLLIADTSKDEQELLQAIDKAGISELINTLPAGLNTDVGQYGYNLSGGELKRLSIARALLKESKIVLLDEPTASLDVKIEKELVNTLQHILKDKSCIWVTHRLINMDWMDEILVMDKGAIIERGTHSELLSLGGLYYELYTMQKKYIYN